MLVVKSAGGSFVLLVPCSVYTHTPKAMLRSRSLAGLCVPPHFMAFERHCTRGGQHARALMFALHSGISVAPDSHALSGIRT
ncbi:hypothetical protein BCR44DRAFT_41452 [Catenaria anguillulae PL171]|uniref:Uncharacterized protein n=1 Tax=Catenaria anguillulae PL171 TaxID=765915 RepID=A0A1Y2G9V9_9FUNG|nr:hypothetical protein BCR44DRAFT_41452 [Catenaria anguillulae PL171]